MTDDPYDNGKDDSDWGGLDEREDMGKDDDHFLLKFLDVDLIVGIAAFAYAVTALFVPVMATLASPTVSFGFALMAWGRWYVRVRRNGYAKTTQ